jgi:HAD superfamily hydrolase (TIGR01509 family)
MRLSPRRCWIFDMDGTLTVPMHDFAWARQQLGVPDGADLLAHVLGRPPADRDRALAWIEAWELDLADRARPVPDAVALLGALRARGARVGVLTRNSLEGAWRTLRAAGLDGHFTDGDVLGRGCAAPKPAPDGVLRLLARWGAAPASGVMVGDYLHDARAGRRAGVATVLVRRHGEAGWEGEADLLVDALWPLADLEAA